MPRISLPSWRQLLLVLAAANCVFRCHTALAFSARSASTKRLSLSTTLPNNNASDTCTVFTIVDVDNVRGKSNFQWTHEGLVERATEWRNANNITMMLALVVDHGSIATLHTGGPLDDQVGIFFSGPQTADDVIVSLVQNHGGIASTTRLVTADQELMMRCRQVMSNKNAQQLKFVEPISFLNEIEALTRNEYTLNLVDNDATTSTNDDDDMSKKHDIGDSIRREVALRQELQMLNRLLHPRGTRSNGKKRQISKKQRTKLVARRDRARERLQELLEQEQQGESTLTSVLDTHSESSILNDAVQAATKNRISTFSAESTYERKLLAERLRRRLDRAGTISLPTDDDCDLSNIQDILWNAKSAIATNINGETQSTANNVNQSLNRDGRSLSSSVLTVPRRVYNVQSPVDDTPSTLLRIVAISDTHGYEHELFAHSQGEKPHLLPPAEVLIHCGDFSESGSRKIKMQARARLDAFLAAQTHIPTKIVIRGNHDPHTPGRVLFPRSQALYVTKPQTMKLAHNVTLGLRPFSRRGTILILPPCDILASHEPPFGLLDMTYQRLRAGSISLRRAVESSSHKPALWLCGHIHEGRGSVLHTFTDQHTDTADSTLIVNSANANAGRANRVVTGPVLVDVVKDLSLLSDPSAWTAGTSADVSPVSLVRTDSLLHMVSRDLELNGQQQEASVDSRRLLAVDLGLRTATVVLSGEGDILDVQDWRFTNHPQLEGALQGILNSHTITHVVVEGNDVKLIRIWKKAVEKYCPDLPFARVVAEDWREALLLPKERKNKQVAKDAAVLIAKQFLKKKKEGQNKAKLTRDAAEAILVGQYVIRILGWVDPQSSPVKRYANGDIVR